ncbi:DUF4168 domain-containing protein [Sphingobium sp. Ndbn-10]|nr:DUF4168 domain-containing protein [Sphingobium sp. Ndbn-10]EQB01204.1 hypothetical protein L286_16485 [Sphingobium sp. HDIP04]
MAYANVTHAMGFNPSMPIRNYLAQGKLMPKILYAAAPLLLLTALPVDAAIAVQTGSVSNDGTSTVSRRQIHAYASALLELQKMRQAVAARAAKLEPQEASLLKKKAQAEMIQIVEKHGLDLASFNAISSQIEQHRRLQRQVKQLMMEELLST